MGIFDHIKPSESLWHELDEAFYEKFPEEWDQEDLYLQGIWFTEILRGKTDKYKRRRAKKDKVTTEHISRNNRKVWLVGTEYWVKDDDKPLREIILEEEQVEGSRRKERYSVEVTKENIIGKIRLIGILPFKKPLKERVLRQEVDEIDTLVFEAIDAD